MTSQLDTIEPKDIAGDPSSLPVLFGNGMAEAIGSCLLPFAQYCGLQPCGEQPGSSVLWQWPSGELKN